jgi:hypothetical protein
MTEAETTRGLGMTMRKKFARPRDGSDAKRGTVWT